jgi:predicted metal-binding membrane protein
MRAAAAALRSLAEGPDWPLLAVAGMAWAILLGAEQIPGAPPICLAEGGDPMASGRLWLSSLAGWDGAAALFAALIAMPVAMTAPLLQVPLSHIRRSTLYERRARSLAFFAAGHVCVWALTAAALMALALGLRLLVSSAFATTGLVVAAALIWHGTPLKPITRNRSHVRLPIPACGARADAAAMRYGAQSACWCAASCWPLMLAPMTGGAAHLAMTAAAASVMLCERVARPIGAVARWRWIGAGVAVGAVVVIAILVRTP